MRTIREVLQIASPNFTALELKASISVCSSYNHSSGKGAGTRHLLPLKARELKEHIDLAEFARGYTRLHRSGRQLVGLCPLHSERHPSFYVHPERQIWFCFGCNRGGDVFDFVMRVVGCDFLHALRIVAEFSGRVARDCETRSGSRFDAGEGAQPLNAAKRRAPHSPFEASRARILAALDAADRRLARIAATNAKTSAALATACEPERGESPLLVNHE
jgi:hypothetical protein